jgi:hypothetical protein
MRIQREGAQLQIRGTWSAGPGDDQARFLADLRALRDSAAIGYDELAARAHYPSDILKEAENGPYLPGLPILTAYVRACEGDVLDWEERWRRLNPEVADDPDLPVRPAGASPAAVAGARAGVGVGPPDVYDPDRIRAALRGGHTRSDRDTQRASDQGISALAHGAARSESSDQDLLTDSGASRDGGTSWDSGASRDGSANWDSGASRDGGASRGSSPSWDTPADPSVSSANGNHSAASGTRGPFDAAFTVLPDPGERTEPARDQDFSWLDNSQPASVPAEPADRGYTWLDQADTPLAAQPEAAPAPEPAVTERIPRPQADGLTSPERTDFWSKPDQADGLTVPERTDFWSKPATPAPADLPRPAPAARAEEPVIARASWPAHADSATTQAPEPAQRAATDAVSVAAATARPLGSAGSVSSVGSAAQATDRQRGNRRQDRFFPVRLLAVIVIAALIGSALVLLLK